MAWAVRDSTGYLAIFAGEPELNLFWGMWEGDSDPWEWREAFGPDPFPEQQVEDEPVEVEVKVRRRGMNEQQATVVWATRDVNGQLAFFGKKPTLHEHFGIWEADSDSWEWSGEFGPDPLPGLKATDEPVEIEIIIRRLNASGRGSKGDDDMDKCPMEAYPAYFKAKTMACRARLNLLSAREIVDAHGWDIEEFIRREDMPVFLGELWSGRECMDKSVPAAMAAWSPDSRTAESEGNEVMERLITDAEVRLMEIAVQIPNTGEVRGIVKIYEELKGAILSPSKPESEDVSR